MLRASKFYLQRPSGNTEVPFLLVKVMKVIYTDSPTNKIQWGAWCQDWEISTEGEDMDYFADPYHASSNHADGQVYREGKNGNPTWSYEAHELSTFQDEVVMNKSFNKKPYKHAAAHNHTHPQPRHLAVPYHIVQLLPLHLLGAGRKSCAPAGVYTRERSTQSNTTKSATSCSDGRQQGRTLRGTGCR